MITGATSGFGKACAEKFAENGWNLILTGRRKDRLENLKVELTQFGIDVIILNFDVRYSAEVDLAIKKITNDVLPKIQVLINNAGLAAGRDNFQDGNLEDWETMIDTNLKGLLYVSKCLSKIMIENKRGHIINISSIAGKEVYPAGNVYCATKHAVDAISKAMRMDLIQHGIKITNIAPGAAETEFSLVRFKGNVSLAKQVYDGYKPLSAKDIAEIVYYTANLPAHVCINDLTVTPSAQASAMIFNKGLK
jgi:3-hydroxy acid dehydrogenase/malonic semialdehyde reductase